MVAKGVWEPAMRDKGLVPARGALRFGNRDPRYHGASPPWRRKEAASRGRVGYKQQKGPLAWLKRLTQSGETHGQVQSPSIDTSLNPPASNVEMQRRHGRLEELAAWTAVYGAVSASPRFDHVSFIQWNGHDKGPDRQTRRLGQSSL
ncbi:hypothetical protein L1887_61430 [Cichorium endivia]|nr:hypothetical protein L1887_61430 [Cichorium endivia]